MSFAAPASTIADEQSRRINHRPAYAHHALPIGSEDDVFGNAPAGASMSARGSVSPASIFDIPEVREEHEQFTEPTTAQASGADEASYDLKPPPPSVSLDNVESLTLRLFSPDHLDVILRDKQLASRFSRFLERYRPQLASHLTRYADMKKAIAAVEYANALADQVPVPPGHPHHIAATVNQRFEERAKATVDDLVDEALPAYITHRLVTLVTDTLVKEITGNNAPIMRELIPSLAEVYCVTDPSLPDNPIVYASEEFYNTTQYGREYVIGRNCRFLQGPKSSNSTVRRLIDALTAGQEICETILNYRRDGSPFVNLLMLAPLYDNKGQVRYFLGCQIDVSSLIEGGRGIESFAQLLAQDRAESRFGDRLEKDPKYMLGEFSAMLNEEDSNVVKNRTRRYSEESNRSIPQERLAYRGRRILGMEDTPTERALWPHVSLGPSGRLPGVYQNYLLVRPYPSLRITFTSPALRIPGLLQTKFLDRIGGPQHVREGILESLAHGQGVTAKISWLTNSASSVAGDRQSLALEGKPRWIHCTPMLGSDERVGVWMVVMVENEEVTGQLNRHRYESTPGSPTALGAASSSYNGNKLYAEYLRREGKPTAFGSQRGGSQRTQSSARDREIEKEIREVDEHFKDF
ncbi:hypothetical protein D0863_01592 [Hortaea werneckii]|uniref:PAC domain-containing protein n=1 Tax=Hortaea werneckii TaxID=91943 RepID=A0A3M7EKM0_HORWE|nr:hypothetical protein D0863_01592 [Hortaea werneckii]